MDIDYPPIKYTQPIEFKYKDTIFHCIFDEEKWDELDGFHIFDYQVYLLEKNKIKDRGYYEYSALYFMNSVIPMINQKAKLLGNKLSLFIFDWESDNPYNMFNLNSKIDRRIQIFGDEIKSEYDYKLVNKNFSFTHTISSFLFPDTLDIKKLHFLSEYTKKNKVECKINFPLRRLAGAKIAVVDTIIKNKLKNIHLSVSSYHETDDVDFDTKFLFDYLKSNTKFINKRSYGIDDFGGESNRENMIEFMWKVIDIADINIINEWTPYQVIDNMSYESIKQVGFSFITEKSVSHIMLEKPFIPIHYSTINFYENMCKKYNLDLPSFPLKYIELKDILCELDENINDENYYKRLLENLKNYVVVLKSNILKILKHNNDYLDFILESNFENKLNLL